MSIYLTGDTHGAEGIRKLIHSEELQGLTKEDYVIVLGDFGMLWGFNESQLENDLIYEINKCPFTLLWLPGNHENYDRIALLPYVHKFGSTVSYQSDHLFMLRTGHCYLLGDKKVFVYGGAESIDRNKRIPGISWWKAEVPSYAEQEIAAATLSHYKDEIDVVLTHTAPKHVVLDMIEKKLLGESSRLYTDQVSDQLSFIEEHFLAERIKENKLKWYFGHYHINSEIDNTFTCLYDKIIKLD